MSGAGKISIFDISEDVLCAARALVDAQEAPAQEAIYSSNTQDTHTCVRCKATFESVEEQRAHFKGDWHRWNLQRIANGLAAQTEAEFETLKESKTDEYKTVDARGEDVEVEIRVISLSDEDADDSESSDEEEEYEEVVKKRSIVVRVLETAYHFSLYFGPVLSARRPLVSLRTCIVLLRSGRFAGAVFRGREVIRHKNLRRYTVRGKAGGSQSKHDSGGRRAKSIGSWLRRQGEKRLMEDVRALLQEWSGEIAQCDLIFLSIPKRMYHVVFGYDGAILRHRSQNTHSIPFAVHKPTHVEVQRMFGLLMEVSIHSVLENVKPDESVPQVQNVEIHPVVVDASLVEDENEQTPAEEENLNPLLVACLQGNVQSALEILAHMDEEGAIADEVFEWVCSMNRDGMTPLHVAAGMGLVTLVKELLDRGASPTVTDFKSRVPYFLCAGKAVRDEFRKARADYPDRWDWERSGVPSALTEDIIQERKQKEREKRKRKKAKDKASKQSQQQSTRAQGDDEIKDEGNGEGDYFASDLQHSAEMAVPAPPTVALPPEPEAGTEGCTCVCVRMEGGRAITRRVKLSDPVELLFMCVCVELEPAEGGGDTPYNFDLVTRFPVRSLSADMQNSIGQTGLANSAVMMRWR